MLKKLLFLLALVFPVSVFSQVHAPDRPLDVKQWYGIGQVNTAIPLYTQGANTYNFNYLAGAVKHANSKAYDLACEDLGGSNLYCVLDVMIMGPGGAVIDTVDFFSAIPVNDTGMDVGAVLYARDGAASPVNAKAVNMQVGSGAAPFIPPQKSPILSNTLNTTTSIYGWLAAGGAAGINAMDMSTVPVETAATNFALLGMNEIIGKTKAGTYHHVMADLFATAIAANRADHYAEFVNSASYFVDLTAPGTTALPQWGALYADGQAVASTPWGVAMTAGRSAVNTASPIDAILAHADAQAVTLNGLVTGSFNYAWDATDNHMDLVRIDHLTGRVLVDGLTTLLPYTPVKEGPTAVIGALTEVLSSKEILPYTNICVWLKNTGGGGGTAFTDADLRVSPDNTNWTSVAWSDCDGLTTGNVCVRCTSGNGYRYARVRVNAANTTVEAWITGNNG